MLLVYHKIAPESPSKWWVTVDEFYRHLCELSAYEVVYLDRYDPTNQNHRVITFDGVYQNVATFAAPLLRKFNYPFELFLSEGQGRELDAEEPAAPFASRDDLIEMVSLGGRLQWAGIQEVNSEEMLEEGLLVPAALQELDREGFRWFSYSHGRQGEERLVKKRAIYQREEHRELDRLALSPVQVTNESSFRKHTIGVAIPSYNYGHFLPEAVESVLRQTRPPDKIVVADDCSADDSFTIAQYYAERYPGMVTAYRNEENLGIVRNFNKAVEVLGTDYVCFLGADNRFRADYIEKTSRILDTEDATAIAYTDFALFGPRANIDVELFDKASRGDVLFNTYFLIHFPEFDALSPDTLASRNVMHGSSLFRRSAFEEVGGYLETSQAEDHNLFLRMVKRGWRARRSPHPLLEYRKHSSAQSNAQFVSFAQLNFYRNLVRHKDERIQHLQEQLARRSPIWATFLLVIRGFRGVISLVPHQQRLRVKGKIRTLLVACQRCEHPIFRLRGYIPRGVRRWVGTVIWRIQKEYFP